ncbi:MAG: DUF485 domain-containing protein [Planctomycetota bacterium]
MHSHTTRLGLVLFAVYLALYGGFVFLNALAPEAMESTPIAGLSVAVLYGLCLIVAAFVLALLYGWLASRADQRATDHAARTRGAGGKS